MFDKRKLAGIGQRIKDKREDKDITQQSLGAKIGLGKSGISKIENNMQLPTLEQIVDIANALDVKIEYILGVDKEADFIRDFINAFDEITTTNEYSAKDESVYDSKDFIFQTDEDYLMLTGNESLFVLIKDIANAKSLQPKLSKNNYFHMLQVAKQKFKQNRANSKNKPYFLISGEQMKEIIDSAVLKKGYLENLFEEVGLTTPVNGQSLPDLKSIRKKKNEQE
jgi:transcriptional regulator with XRE-family HTH domain